MKITIPKMERWEQIDGDMDPGAYGGTIARSAGDSLELLKIQPVREYVGDGEAADVGFPFWTREAYFDADDLDPGRDDVQGALDSIGMSIDDLEELTPTQRAITIATALLDYGVAEEGQSGWSDDIVHDDVKWADGTVAGPEYLADEDEAFVREVLLADLDVDYESYGPDEDEPTSGLRVSARDAGGYVEITEWTDIEHATGEDQPEGARVLRVDTQVDLDELMGPGKHRGLYSRDQKSIGFMDLGKMEPEEREEAIVAAAISYIGYFGGEEENVESVGD